MTKTHSKWAAILAALIFLITLNLRPAITAVGPLIGDIGAAAALNNSMLGLLGALPLIAFALISPLVHHPAGRWGMERTILISMFVLAAGLIVRSYTGFAGLWIGTAIIGCSIAVGNVLVPAIVKRDYANHISLATGIYSAVMSVGAGVAAGLAVPIADRKGLEFALAIWAAPVVLVAILWIARTRTIIAVAEDTIINEHIEASIWKNPTAWLVTAFFAVQSMMFYISITWLPTIEISNGLSARQAGLNLFIFQMVAIVSSLAVPRIMRRPENLLVAGLSSSAAWLIGFIGLLVLPQYGTPWVVIAGLGSGASLVVALALISFRGRNPHETTQLSGMAQSLGYLFAASGPIVCGVLSQQTGSWDSALILMITLGFLLTFVAIVAGKDRRQRLVSD